MRLNISARLRDACLKTPEAALWLKRLPEAVDELERRWSLTLGIPFDGEDVSCAWVAPAMRIDRTPVVLKLAMPHFEGEQEIDGLRFWNGDPTVRLLESDPSLGAMLLVPLQSALKKDPLCHSDIPIS